MTNKSLIYKEGFKAGREAERLRNKEAIAFFEHLKNHKEVHCKICGKSSKEILAEELKNKIKTEAKK